MGQNAALNLVIWNLSYGSNALSAVLKMFESKNRELLKPIYPVDDAACG